MGDLSLIAEQHKLRYYLKIYDKLESEALKNKCREHMFKEIDMEIERPQVEQVDQSRYNYFRCSDEESEEDFPDCTTYTHKNDNFYMRYGILHWRYLILFSDKIHKDI